MEGKHATKRPISATVTSGSTFRTPFTRHTSQPAPSSGQAQQALPQTTTALEPHSGPRPSAAAAAPPQLRGPRSIAQLRGLNRQEQDALIRGEDRRKPPLQRALSFPGKSTGEAAADGDKEEDVRMRQLMQELRRCRYLRTSQECTEDWGEG